MLVWTDLMNMLMCLVELKEPNAIVNDIHKDHAAMDYYVNGTMLDGEFAPKTIQNENTTVLLISSSFIVIEKIFKPSNRTALYK